MSILKIHPHAEEAESWQNRSAPKQITTEGGQVEKIHYSIEKLSLMNNCPQYYPNYKEVVLPRFTEQKMRWRYSQEHNKWFPFVDEDRPNFTRCCFYHYPL